MFCKDCGHELNDKAVMCVGCGVSINNFNKNEKSKYAGFWKRVWASSLDSIIVYIPLGIIGSFMGAFNYMYDPNYWDFSNPNYYNDPYSDSAYLLFQLLSTVVYLVYNIGFHASSYQATPGKMALGIIVTDLDGNRISVGRAIGRYFSMIVSGCILYVGFMMAGWTHKKQALHDMMAGTLVVNKHSS